MEAILIGYLPKKPAPELELLRSSGAREVCSVSSCSFDNPDDWIELWKHNDYFLYNSPEEALSLIDNLKDKEAYDLYAFKQYPFLVDKGTVIHEELSSGTVKPLPEDFEFLGYDAVNKLEDSGVFLCSPLSCNYGYQVLQVNQFFLFDTFEEALTGAILFSKGGWEEGLYYVIAVYREIKSKRS